MIDACERRQPRPSQLPLQGVRVLSMEQFGAGPYGSMFLANLGADVVKIENPASGGDPARHTGPHFLGESDSQYFQGWNLGKKSIELDLKTGEGRAAFDVLIREADVFLNNLRGDQAAKLGVEYAGLRDLNPALVCVHISAYGRDTSRTAWPGYDYLMQAESGLMGLTGEPGTPPARIGAPSIIDHMAGITAMVGLLSALLRARETGEGCDVDTCLFDVAVHQLGYAATWYLNEGDVTQRQPRSGHYSVAPVQTFQTTDGWVFVMCMTQKFWEELLAVLVRPDLGEMPEFRTMAARHANREYLTQVLDAEFGRHPTGYWLEQLEGRLPIAPVLGLAEALESDFIRESGMLSDVSHPAKPQLRVLANPLKFDGRRPALKACSARGEDGETVMTERKRGRNEA
ncbi:CoA transferase [Luteimonas sp. BDR2-5]|uniref:CaiB/BaiF CoA transferase family protein n=1 Tax=Proluteimonas luteida TaxID=2878685 RepID=UPI002104FE7C|nr:CoA transferase [Luteimonas sp. BDR2-5]MCD9029732.1 CoA transferase [Luteimonas sp. BDR2-5]